MTPGRNSCTGCQPRYRTGRGVRCGTDWGHVGRAGARQCAESDLCTVPRIAVIHDRQPAPDSPPLDSMGLVIADFVSWLPRAPRNAESDRLPGVPKAHRIRNQSKLYTLILCCATQSTNRCNTPGCPGTVDTLVKSSTHSVGMLTNFVENYTIPTFRNRSLPEVVPPFPVISYKMHTMTRNVHAWMGFLGNIVRFPKEALNHFQTSVTSKNGSCSFLTTHSAKMNWQEMCRLGWWIFH